jgi:NAD(P)-dependent dehydrogenase (short-subunit alcohol dehydrogenase family)
VKTRSVLITGAAGGIGRALAEAFAEIGDALVFADADADRGRVLAAELTSGGADAMFVRCDVTCPEDHAALVAAAVERHGRLDVALNNAGVTHLPAEVADFESPNSTASSGSTCAGCFSACATSFR